MTSLSSLDPESLIFNRIELICLGVCPGAPRIERRVIVRTLNLQNGSSDRFDIGPNFVGLLESPRVIQQSVDAFPFNPSLLFAFLPFELGLSSAGTLLNLRLSLHLPIVVGANGLPILNLSHNDNLDGNLT